MADAYIPIYDGPKMEKVGAHIKGVFDTYEKDRKDLELQWLTNLRQVKGIYDPAIDKAIPDDQSTAYPKITRNKVIGTVARLMEMLFPRTDKNYEVMESKLPNLEAADLQRVLDTLQSENQGAVLTDDMIEKAIKSYAKEKAKNLDREIEDQLQELDYITLVRGVLKSGVTHGPGCLVGPLVVKEQGRTWTKDVNGRYVASTIERKRPYFELRPVWDIYTDLSAKTLDSTDGEFVRHIMTRAQVRLLADRKDFIGDRIKRYLKEHTKGNYKERHWETALRTKSSDRANVQDMSGRKFELIEYWGRLSGHDLSACGVQIADDKLADEFEANVWLIDNVVIKALLNPYDGKHRGFHWFIYEEDDCNLLGNGVPVVMRDSQMAICEAARMVLDNGSVICGPQLEVNESALKPGQDLDVYARKIWVREDSDLSAQFPAVREIKIEGHIPELISIIDLFTTFADQETALPPPALGDVSGQGKESLRTSQNMSMLLGAAALPIRDTVRNFDRFTESVIGALCQWNMEFNPKESIKGDHTVLAKGSTSLIAKEVRATALDQFWLSLDAEDKIYFNRKKVNLERMRVRDLPDELLEDDDTVAKKLDEQARNAQLMGQQQADLLRAQVRGEVAGAFKDLMLGLKAQAGANADTFNALVEGMINVRAATAEPARPAGGGGRTSANAAQPSQRAGASGAAPAA